MVRAGAPVSPAPAGSLTQTNGDDMKPKWILITVAAWLTAVPAGALALVASPDAADPGAPPGAVAPAHPAAWKFQVGAGWRVGGERVRDDAGESYAGLDLSWSKWQRNRSAWGLGLHGAFSDDGGPRFAPRLHWRTPLGSGRTFVQAAGGVYLVAIDKEMSGPPLSRINLPGWFGEVELGVSEAFSVVAGIESLPVDLFADDLGYFEETEDATPIASSTIKNLWLGARAGGKAGVLVTLAGAAAVGILAAALSSGWN